MDNVKKFKSKIDKVKNALITKSKRKGIYKNFGQKEGRYLRDEINSEFDPYTSEWKELIDYVFQFDDWCQTYNG
jgi:hypothetical protein